MEHDASALPALLAVDARRHFRRVVEAYQHQLYTFAYRLTSNQQMAEDIVQEAFVRAYVACVAYAPERVRALKLRPWLYKITLNEFYHAVRGARLHVMPLDLSEESPILEIQDAEGERPDFLVERRERLQEIEAALLQMPERYRVPILCLYFEHLSYRETADLLDQPLGSVKSAVFRGTRLLQTLLATEGKEGEPWSRKTANRK
ncbi:MAG TPA: RNA polymerase sigma factor [Ktedonobacterales bacterium]